MKKIMLYSGVKSIWKPLMLQVVQLKKRFVISIIGTLQTIAPSPRQCRDQ